jgi:hypothetical protein
MQLIAPSTGRRNEYLILIKGKKRPEVIQPYHRVVADCDAWINERPEPTGRLFCDARQQAAASKSNQNGGNREPRYHESVERSAVGSARHGSRAE